jgi:hypothetical protein
MPELREQTDCPSGVLMNHLQIDTSVEEVRAAISDDRTARAEAMRLGMLATQPLSVSRLGELCELGDRMIRTSWRKQLALDHIGALLGRVFSAPSDSSSAGVSKTLRRRCIDE